MIYAIHWFANHKQLFDTQTLDSRNTVTCAGISMVLVNMLDLT